MNGVHGTVLATRNDALDLSPKGEASVNGSETINVKDLVTS